VKQWVDIVVFSVVQPCTSERTAVSEEHIASIFRIEESTDQEASLANGAWNTWPDPNRSTCIAFEDKDSIIGRDAFYPQQCYS
jgi:hypothetical protein